MTNTAFLGAQGAMGGPLTLTLVSIDGSFVAAVGLAVLLMGGVLFFAALGRSRPRRRMTVRSGARLRRAAA